MRKKRRRRRAPAGGGGSLLLDVLTLPVLGAPRMVHWVARKVIEEAEREQFDEGKLQGQLLDLQVRHELGELNDEEYAEQEAAILGKLNSIRKAREEE